MDCGGVHRFLKYYRGFSTFSPLDKHKLKDFKRDVRNMARFRICARALMLTAVC